MAEEDRRSTPYGYTFDDPIRHTDPDGMFGEDANEENSANCCGGGPSPAKIILGAGLTAAGIEVTVAAPTVVGEAVAIPAAVVTTGVTLIVAGSVALYDAFFGGHNNNSTHVESAPQSTQEKEKNPPNPNGAKGDPNHQKQVKDLADQQRAENPNKDVLQEQKIRHDGSTRKPDVQVVNRETGKVEKVHEVERHPTHKRNRHREAEYNRLKIPNQTHPLKTPGT